MNNPQHHLLSPTQVEREILIQLRDTNILLSQLVLLSAGDTTDPSVGDNIYKLVNGVLENTSALSQKLNEK